MSRVFCPIVLLPLLAFCGPAQAQRGARPDLYFYRTAITLEDGSQVFGFEVFSPHDMATFPESQEMSGVILMVHWSTLCPAADRCDYSIIDKSLEYWRARGKKVVLSVTTIGWPHKVLNNGKEALVGATPDWVLAKVGAFTTKDGVSFGKIGGKEGEAHGLTVDLPQFWRPAYLVDLERLIHQLAQRYDGNPTIAQLRMSLGMETEENPPVGWFGQTPSGYSEIGWVKLCGDIARIYEREFQRTHLEFDISRMAVGYAFLNDGAYRAAVDGLLNELKQHNVFLAYNGLARPRPENKVGFAAHQYAYSQVQRFAPSPRNGGGLELVGPLWQQDGIAAMAEIVNRTRPNRLVMFGPEAAAINYRRLGKNPANRGPIDRLTQQKKIDVEIANTALLLRLIGYTD